MVPQGLLRPLVADPPEGPPAKARPASDSARERLALAFRQHYDGVWRLLRRLGLDPIRADDLAQQAFLITGERMADIEPHKERAFAVATALRLARTVHRETHRELLEPEPTERAAEFPNPEQLAEQKEDRAVLDLLLGRLELELRAVFVLYELEGFSTREIAELLAIPLGTAASRLRRAREEFRAQVQRWTAQNGERRRGP